MNSTSGKAGRLRGAPRPRRNPTIVDVAARARVNPSVVSRLLNSYPTLRIRPETELRIRTAVADLGYVPQHAGRALRTARTGTIGLFVPDVTNALYDEVRRGVQLAAADAGYVVLIGNADDASHDEGAYRRLVGESRLDGVLLQRSSWLDDAAFLRLTDTLIPTVLVNTRAESVHGSVILDDEEGAAVAVRHLADSGHTRIGILSGVSTVDWSQRREAGFRRTMLERGLEVRAEWSIEAGYAPDTGAAAMNRLLQLDDQPTAVFVANVMACIGALGAAHGAGVAAPDRLSIVAFHDTWFAEHTWPPITTVKMPLFEMGKYAATSLLARLSGAPPEDIMITSPAPALILRGSTGPPSQPRGHPDSRSGGRE